MKERTPGELYSTRKRKKKKRRGGDRSEIDARKKAEYNIT